MLKDEATKRSAVFDQAQGEDESNTHAEFHRTRPAIDLDLGLAPLSPRGKELQPCSFLVGDFPVTNACTQSANYLEGGPVGNSQMCLC